MVVLYAKIYNYSNNNFRIKVSGVYCYRVTSDSSTYSWKDDLKKWGLYRK